MPNSARVVSIPEQFMALAEAYLGATIRMAPALAAFFKSGKVADSGKGRVHRYFER